MGKKNAGKKTVLGKKTVSQILRKTERQKRRLTIALV